PGQTGCYDARCASGSRRHTPRYLGSISFPGDRKKHVGTWRAISWTEQQIRRGAWYAPLTLIPVTQSLNRHIGNAAAGLWSRIITIQSHKHDTRLRHGKFYRKFLQIPGSQMKKLYIALHHGDKWD